MLEDLVFLAIYGFLPILLLIRKFGIKITGILAGVSIFLYTLVPMPEEVNQVTLPINPDLSMVILASSNPSGPPRKFVQPLIDRRDPRQSGSGGGSSYNPNSQYRSGNPNGNGGSGLSDTYLKSNQLPPESNRQVDPDDWDNSDADSCQDFEENTSNSFGVPLDFEYKLDSNGKPTLLVPNIDPSTRTERGKSLQRVEYGQTGTHLQHAGELGITLPPSFDMRAYEKMNKADRLAYANTHVSPETIIAYQNAIANSMVPQINAIIRPFTGVAGVNKKPIRVIVQTIPKNTEMVKISVIRENGIHATTYTMKVEKYISLMADPNKF